MRSIILLVFMATVMASLVIAGALPALAAPPTLYVECRTGGVVDACIADISETYNEANTLYSDCTPQGSGAMRDITPNSAAPTR
jgi:hypothetical protein